MQDKLVAVGAVMTGGVVGVGWLEYASDAATLLAAIVVGGLTAWYTWERAAKLKRERRDATNAKAKLSGGRRPSGPGEEHEQ